MCFLMWHSHLSEHKGQGFALSLSIDPESNPGLSLLGLREACMADLKHQLSVCSHVSSVSTLEAFSRVCGGGGAVLQRS